LEWVQVSEKVWASGKALELEEVFLLALVVPRGQYKRQVKSRR
jgi:hypothetical protein